MNIKTIFHHPLTKPFILAGMLRIGFLVISHHTYYPDEIFQSLEQAYRIVHRYGLLPWDVAYGLRSFFFPFVLAIPLKLADILHIFSPEVSRFFPQILLSLFSLTIPAAGYVLVKQSTKKLAPALFVAYGLSVWYELIYLSGRGLTEMVSLDCFALAVLCLFRKKPYVFWVAVCITLGFFLRIQFFPIAIMLWIILVKQQRAYLKTALGTGVVISIFGMIDWKVTGLFLGHLYRNLSLSFGSGISTLFGAQPWFFYLITLTITSCGLWLSTFLIPKKSPAKWIQYTSILLILIHSCIPHKEYRFILALIPIWIILLSIVLHHFFSKLGTRYITTAWSYATIGICFLSLLGMLHRLPYESRVYGQPLLYTDPIFSIYDQLSREPITCGVFDTTRNWVYTPGYIGINKHVELYSIDYPPPNATITDYVIIPKSIVVPSGFSLVMSTKPYELYVRGQKTLLPGYMLIKRNEPCKKNQTYSYNRSFPAVESVLQSIHALPVIHE